MLIKIEIILCFLTSCESQLGPLVAGQANIFHQLFVRSNFGVDKMYEKCESWKDSNPKIKAIEYLI